METIMNWVVSNWVFILAWFAIMARINAKNVIIENLIERLKVNDCNKYGLTSSHNINIEQSLASPIAYPIQTHRHALI